MHVPPRLRRCAQVSQRHPLLAPAFRARPTDGVALLSLDDGWLEQDLGITDPAQRRALLLDVQALKDAAARRGGLAVATSAAASALLSGGGGEGGGMLAEMTGGAVGGLVAAAAGALGEAGDAVESALAVALNVLSIAEGLPFAKPVAEAVKLILSGVLNARVNKRACGALGGTVGSLARLMQQALPSLIQGGRTKSDLPFWCDDSFTMPTASLPLARPLPLVVAILRPPTSIALRPPTPP